MAARIANFLPAMIKLIFVGLAWYIHSLQFALCASALLKSHQVTVYECLFHQLATSGTGAFAALLATSYCRRQALWLCVTDHELIRATILPAGAYAMGVWATNSALSGTSIGLTYIVKAIEPLFTVVLVVLLVGIYPTTKELLAVTVAVVGCIITVTSNLEVQWRAVTFAFASNLFFQLRNVLGKRSMTVPSLVDCGLSKGEVSLLLIMLWSLGGLVVALALTPILLYLNDEPAFTSHVNPDYAHSSHVAQWMAVHFSTYQICSTLVLSAVSPVMHALANSLKRGTVIFGSALVLGLVITSQKAFGIIVTLTGVYLYSLWKQAPAPVPSKSSQKKTDLCPWWLVVIVVTLSALSAVVVQPHATRIPSQSKSLRDLALPNVSAGQTRDRTTIFAPSPPQQELTAATPSELLPSTDHFSVLHLAWSRPSLPNAEQLAAVTQLASRADHINLICSNINYYQLLVPFLPSNITVGMAVHDLEPNPSPLATVQWRVLSVLTALSKDGGVYLPWSAATVVLRNATLSAGIPKAECDADNVCTPALPVLAAQRGARVVDGCLRDAMAVFQTKALVADEVASWVGSCMAA
eukprot:m.116417 g.116417  ORF g.116417 m.116417 type:complete len:582 (-) comp15518_c0_seq2:127-1872(-)